MPRSALQKLGEGGSRQVNRRKCLNFLFWYDLDPNYIIKVYSFWTEMKMPTGAIQKFHIYDVEERHVVRRPGPVCAASPGAWAFSGRQPQRHTGKNFQCGHHTSIFPFAFTLSLVLCWSPEVDPRLTSSWGFLSFACLRPVLRMRGRGCSHHVGCVGNSQLAKAGF